MHSKVERLKEGIRELEEIERSDSKLTEEQQTLLKTRKEEITIQESKLTKIRSEIQIEDNKINNFGKEFVEKEETLEAKKKEEKE